MLFFNKKTSIEKSGLFSGMTDWHSHILPGVDDGVKTIEESLEILQRYGELGVKSVWLTPHIMEDMPNTTDELRARFEELKSAYDGSIELHLASENMLDNLFDERLEADDFLPLGLDGKHLLVETSYVNPPSDMDYKLKALMAKGYHPVLAHPERYIYMEKSDYEKYLAMGTIFQLNIFSMLGVYGKTAQKKASTLLKMSLPSGAIRVDLPLNSTDSNPSASQTPISLFGSDLHSARQLEKFIAKEELSKSEISLLPITK